MDVSETVSHTLDHSFPSEGEKMHGLHFEYEYLLFSHLCEGAANEGVPLEKLAALAALVGHPLTNIELVHAFSVLQHAGVPGNMQVFQQLYSSLATYFPLQPKQAPLTSEQSLPWITLEQSLSEQDVFLQEHLQAQWGLKGKAGRRRSVKRQEEVKPEGKPKRGRLLFMLLVGVLIALGAQKLGLIPDAVRLWFVGK